MKRFKEYLKEKFGVVIEVGDLHRIISSALCDSELDAPVDTIAGELTRRYGIDVPFGDIALFIDPSCLSCSGILKRMSARLATYIVSDTRYAGPQKNYVAGFDVELVLDGKTSWTNTLWIEGDPNRVFNNPEFKNEFLKTGIPTGKTRFHGYRRDVPTTVNKTGFVR